MKRFGAIVLAALFVFIATGCAGRQAVVNARLRDRIFGVEPRVSGATVVWMVHDDVGTYCTMDAQLAAEANRLFESGEEVMLTYSSINVGDREYSLLGISGCTREGGESSQAYKIVAITIAPSKPE